MIINWKTLLEEEPLAIDLLCRETGFEYDVAYHAPIKNDRIFKYEDLEEFLDHRGWHMIIYCAKNNERYGMDWIGVIVDGTGNTVYQNNDDFSDVRSRSHAKSLLATIAIKYYGEAMKQMCVIPEDSLVVSMDEINQQKGKVFSEYTFEDLKDDMKILSANVDCVVLQGDDDNPMKMVLKNTRKYPYVGQLL